MPTQPLGRYTGTSIAEQVGVVRLSEDAGAAARGLIGGTARMGALALDMLDHAQAQYIADFGLDQRKKAAELQTQNAYDPEGFRKAWEAHGEGTLNAVPAAFQARARLSLKAVGESGYEDVLSRTAAKTQRNAVQSWDLEGQAKKADYLAKAAGAVTGKYTKDQVEAARVAYSLHLKDGVRLKVLDEKGAALLADQLVVKAHAETFGADTERTVKGMLAQPEPATPGGVRTTSGGTNVAYQNNNPGNVMVPGKDVAAFAKIYPGAIGVDERGFAKFSTPEAGLAAMAQVIRGYGETTLLGVLSRYAPKGHGKNDPEAYAATVGNALGISRAAKIDTSDPAFMAKLLPAMIAVETGQPPKYDPALYAAAATPFARAREFVRQRMEEFRTNPEYASIRQPVTVAAIEGRVNRTLHDLQSDYELARARNNEDLNVFLQRLSNGLGIDAAEAQTRADEARRLGDRKGAQRWEMISTKGAALAEFGALPIKEQAVELQAAFDRANDPKADSGALFEYEIKKSVFARTQALYKADPFAGAIRTMGGERPPDIDFTQGDWQDRLQAQREKYGDAASAREGTPVVPLFTEQKLRLAQFISASPPSQQTAIMAQVDKALGRYAPYFWQEIGGKKDQGGDRLASLAAVSRENAGLGRDIADGRAARLANPHYAPKDDAALRAQFDGTIGAAFRMIPDARETYIQEVTDLYAKRMKDQGNTTGIFDSSAFSKAMTQRFGGDLVDWRGVKTIPPAPGVDRSGMREWMGTLLPMDLGLDGALPILPSTKKQIGVDVIARNAKLYAVGDGRYTAEIEGEQLANPKTGRAWVLDYANWARRKAIDDAHRGSLR